VASGCLDDSTSSRCSPSRDERITTLQAPIFGDPGDAHGHGATPRPAHIEVTVLAPDEERGRVLAAGVLGEVIELLQSSGAR
jgi:hypothetical protein